MWLAVINTDENTFCSVHRKHARRDNDDAYGRARARRDITTTNVAGSGRPGVVRYTHRNGATFTAGR